MYFFKHNIPKVIDEMQAKGTSTEEMDKLKKDLEKSQKEVKEGAVERERYQAQLEMLVQELEQKQVDALFGHR